MCVQMCITVVWGRLYVTAISKLINTSAEKKKMAEGPVSCGKRETEYA